MDLITGAGEASLRHAGAVLDSVHIESLPTEPIDISALILHQEAAGNEGA
jgi:hypothetical protein